MNQYKYYAMRKEASMKLNRMNFLESEIEMLKKFITKGKDLRDFYIKVKTVKEKHFIIKELDKMQILYTIEWDSENFNDRKYKFTFNYNYLKEKEVFLK